MAEQVVANPAEMEQTAATVAEPKGESLPLRAIDSAWRLLRRPWLLVALLILLGATLLWARMIPQVPGQLTESAAETTRWLNATLASTSIPGAELARTLGLFDLYASPWLRVILALITLLGAVQLADGLGRLLAWRRLPRNVSIGDAGEPVELGVSGVARVRLALDVTPARTEQSVRTWAESAHLDVDGGEAQFPAHDEGVTQGAEQEIETRLLMRRRGWSVWVAPLLATGALIGALILWANIFWAWNLRPDVLPPGATFTSDRHQFSVENAMYFPVYRAEPPVDPDMEAEPGLDFIYRIGERELGAYPDGQWNPVGAWSSTHIRANADTPALVVSADEPILALPSAPKPQEQVGVLLPALGSEQFVVLPGEGIGLRLVRITDGFEEKFWAEVYDDAAVQPIVREEISGARLLEIPLSDGSLVLEIAPARGLQVEVERRYGGWLWLPALLMILAGLVALILPARMLLVQLSPWEKERTLLIAQGTSAKDVVAVTTATNP